MRDFYITIPFFKDLTKESNWDDINGRNRNFFIARCHFKVKVRQVSKGTVTGEILSALQAAKGATVGKVKSIELEEEIIDFKESLESSLISNEMISEVVNNLAVSYGSEGFGRFGNEFKTSWKNRLTTEFYRSFHYSTTIRNKKVEKYEFKYDINSTERLIIPAIYRRMAFDVYLAYIDFLFVDYEKTLFGLRKKRRHNPRYERGRPRNLIDPNFPICCIKFWQRLKHSGVILREEDYVQEVEEPLETEVHPPERFNKTNISFPKNIPSLYQLSVAAFPRKWIRRNGEWTKDELMAIEFEEAKGSPWWYKHGPGKGEW